MKIQYLGYNIKNSDKLAISSFSKPQGFDSFEVNIIDLNHKDIWKNYSQDPIRINLSTDLNLISNIVKKSKSTIVVYIFPQDYLYEYNYREKSGYLNQFNIRKILDKYIPIILKNSLNLEGVYLEFEPNKTKLKNQELT